MKLALSFKSIFAPKSNELKPVESVQLWYVRWTRRYGMFHNETEEVMEAFASSETANEFADSLRAAFTLIRHTSGTKVTVSKN